MSHYGTMTFPLWRGAGGGEGEVSWTSLRGSAKVVMSSGRCRRYSGHRIALGELELSGNLYARLKSRTCQ